MAKERIYELARRYNIPTREFINQLQGLGLKIKSHMSVLEDEDLEIVEEYFKAEESNATEVDEEIFAGKEEVRPAKKAKSVEKQEKPRRNDRNKRNAKRGKGPAPQGKERDQAEQREKKETVAVEVDERIVVKDFADALNLGVGRVISKLIELGVMASQNQEIDYDTAELIAEEFGKKITPKVILTDEEEFNLDYEDAPENLKPRAPVVTVMGHVDHGKTSLLDAIRKTHVTKQEAGGITQHIGASTATVHGQKVVLLDTPGHEAFTTMRMRGAQSTDIAILVVAADDGVMPQTVEAINHAKAAGVPIIVAINKIDKESANPDRVKQELTEYGLVAEEWGGDSIMVPVSALKQEGISDLLEMVLMVAEMQELKANPDRPAVGIVIEARLDKGKGPVANIIVKKGTLNAGDVVVSGSASGRVRAMFDDKGKRIKKAGPSQPAQILGLSEVPEAGDMLYAVEDEKKARAYADVIKSRKRQEMIKPGENVSLDALFSKIQEGQLKDLNLIVKTDVKGTIDAVRGSLEKLSNEEVKVNIIHGAVGGITESDVMLAAASNAIIIGFNVRPNQGAMEQARLSEVDLRTYRVIYDAIDDISAAIQGMLAPTFREEILGRAEVRQVFKVPNVGNVAGVYVTTGKVTRNSSIRLLRNDIVIYEGAVSSLRRFKDDVRELQTSYEGGIGLENYDDVKEGDVLEAFIMQEVEKGEA